jgi:thioredoxin reductase
MPHYIEKARKNPRIEIITNAIVMEIIGDKKSQK